LIHSSRVFCYTAGGVFEVAGTVDSITGETLFPAGP